MQSGSLARFLPAVALVGIGIFSIAASFADGDEVPTFSKAGFHARLAKYIQRTNEACGSQLQLTSDFETITQDDWAQPHEKPSRTMGHIANICSDVFEAVRLLCQNGGDDGPKLKAAIASQLKTIRCQFSDVLPSSASENRGLWMKRNMSFEKGTFTIRIAPGTYPPSEQATEVLRKVLSRAGGPTVPLSALAERGESCELASECGTNYCSKGVCASCSKTNKCPKKLQCYNDGCFTAAEVKEAQDAAASSSSSSSSSSSGGGGSKAAPAAPAATGASHGRMCGKPADCQSGVCKMENKTRGRCQ